MYLGKTNFFKLHKLLRGLTNITFNRGVASVSSDKSQLDSESKDQLHNGAHIDPNYVSGLIDAEGCFMIKLRKNVTYKTGIQVQAIFSINLNQSDRDLLFKIKSFFGGVGNIHMDKVNNTYVYGVTSIQDIINVIIPHINKYPLLTQKRADF
jgi:hypothetical protein